MNDSGYLSPKFFFSFRYSMRVHRPLCRILAMFRCVFCNWCPVESIRRPVYPQLDFPVAAVLEVTVDDVRNKRGCSDGHLQGWSAPHLEEGRLDESHLSWYLLKKLKQYLRGQPSVQETGSAPLGSAEHQIETACR